MWRTYLWLALILFVALALRVWGINFGLPYTLHVDEGALVMPALKILQTGDFNPHHFDYGSLHIYLLALAYIPYFLYGARSGVFQNIQSIPVIDDYHMITTYPYPTVFLVGRVVSALLGVLTVYWAYRVGARIWDRRIGLIAALLLAVMPAAVRMSHFIVGDTSMNLLVLMALEAIVVAYRGRRIIHFATAGLLIGLAAACKQTGVQLAAALLLAAVGWSTARANRPLATAVGLLSVAGGFVLGTPYAVLDLPTFLNWQAYDLHLYARPAAQIFEGPSWIWHWRYLLTSENAILIVVALIGMVMIVRQQRWLGLMLISFPVLHWYSMSSQATRYDRTWLPLTSFVCLFGAVAIVNISTWLSAHVAAVAGRIRLVTGAAVVALAGPFLVGSVMLGIHFNEPDVRLLTLSWIEQNLPKGAHLAVELSRPPLSPSDWNLTYTVALPQHDLAWYRSQGVEYLVASAVMEGNPNRTVADEAWYQHLRATCEPLTTILGPALGLPDIRFRVYDLKTCQD
jgi:4-amino-4-deoxy-L-arabinose transferase-like glycosyltransferase